MSTTTPVIHHCGAEGCNKAAMPHMFLCRQCAEEESRKRFDSKVELSIADKYPQYYKKVGALTAIDVYAVHHLFNIQDPSGCIQHASKKLLLAGVRTGNKSMVKDITEARDTLNRWLELNQQVS